MAAGDTILTSTPAPGLRFGDPRAMALLACLCHYEHLFNRLTNRSRRTLIAGLIAGYSAGQATYDLRRVRRKGLIRQIPAALYRGLKNDSFVTTSAAKRS
jgi:hypothetical protein